MEPEKYFRRLISLAAIAILAACSTGPTKIAGPLTADQATAIIEAQIPNRDVLANIAPVFPWRGGGEALKALQHAGELRSTKSTSTYFNPWRGDTTIIVSSYTPVIGPKVRGSSAHPAFVVGRKAVHELHSLLHAASDNPVATFNVGLIADAWATGLPEVGLARQMLINSGDCTATFTRGATWTAKVSCPTSVRLAGEAPYAGNEKKVSAPASIDPTRQTVTTMFTNGGTLVPCRLVVNQGFMGIGGSAEAFVPKDSPSGNVTSMAALANDGGQNAIGICSLGNGSSSAGNGGDE